MGPEGQTRLICLRDLGVDEPLHFAVSIRMHADRDMTHEVCEHERGGASGYPCERAEDVEQQVWHS